MSQERRQAYLDALGIQRWVRRDLSLDDAPPAQAPDVVPATPAAAPTAATEPAAPDWPTLQSQVTQCQACALAESRTQTVFGVGDPQARVLVIGEAPGAEEDRQGEPFVGPAGQLLDRMLEAIGLTRGDGVYIANILKCRPPNNRDPLPDEVAACGGFLRQQIELIRPRLVLAVGRIAAQSLLASDEPVGRLRGQLHRLDAYGGLPLVVTYHPSYLLRAPLEKRKAWQDLCRCRAALDQGAGG